MGFGAIVEESASGSNLKKDQEFSITKEELEAEAITCYHVALKHHKVGNVNEAIHEYLSLVTSCYIDLENGDENFAFSSKLKYLCLKNIGELYQQTSNKEMALKFFLEALQVDNSKFEIHSMIGKLALELKNYHLARHSYEMAFEINPENLFCAKKYISILFIQENYELCFQILLTILEKNTNFLYGYVLLKELFEISPNLKTWFITHQTKIYQIFSKIKIPVTKSKDILDQLKNERNEAIKISKKKLKESLISPKTLFQKPFELFSWKELGINLLDLHHYLYSADRDDPDNSKPTCFTHPIDFVSLNLEEIHKKCSEEQKESSAKPDKVESHCETPSVDKDGDVEMQPKMETTEKCEAKVDEKPMSEEKVENTEVQTVSSSEEGNGDASKNEKKNNQSKKLCQMNEEVKKKACKRKGDLSMLEDDFKRRSKRVKNSLLASLSSENELNSIMKLLPLCFQKDFNDLCEQRRRSVSDDAAFSEAEEKEAIESIEKDYFTDDEKLNVINFLKEMKEIKSNIVDTILAYLVRIEKYFSIKWPESLKNIYMGLYNCLRTHFDLNIHLNGDFDDEMRKQFISVCLVHLELSVDQNIKDANNNYKDDMLGCFTRNVQDSTLFFEDFYYLTRLAENASSSDFQNEFRIRVHWLNYLINQRKLDTSLECLFSIKSLFNESSNKSVLLPNCVESSEISLEKVMYLINKSEKKMHIEDVFKMYSKGKYNEVIDIIKEVLLQNEDNHIDFTHEENREQISIMINCYIALKEHKSCLEWSVKCFSMYINQLMDPLFKTPLSVNPSQHPLDFFYKILNYINVCMKASDTILSEISFEHLRLLVACVCKLLEVVFEITQDCNGFIMEISCEYVIDLWILLYQLLTWHYCKHLMPQEMQNIDAEDNDDVPSFLMVLITGHDYLARKSWCCSLEGKYMLFLIKEAEFLLLNIQRDYMIDDAIEVFEESDKESAWDKEVTEKKPLDKDKSSTDTKSIKDIELGVGCEAGLCASLEQAFSCLFHYPKKNRTKNYHDHSTQPVALDWNNCHFLYNYFKPSILPEYDSLKQRSITTEFEQLLLKIKTLSKLEESSIFSLQHANVKAFIQGTMEQEPTTAASTEDIHQDLYYLLADYYFKNNETSKAMNFYMMDLAIKPNRFDSWAALALANSKKIEDDLELNLKAPDELSVSTLRCFRRAMQLNESNSKLWIEYGSCTFMLQSTASYLYKAHNNFFMPKLEILNNHNSTTASSVKSLTEKLNVKPENLLTFKQDMLNLSKTCFEQAKKHDCDSEEEWLEHYMLGKMAEKQNNHPSVFLDHYTQAGEILHFEKAKYPKKNISYHNPPHLAVESLEMFYRIHASILKYMLKHEEDLPKIDFDTIERFMLKAKESPLVKGQEHLEKKSDYKKSSDLLFEEESFLLMSGNLSDPQRHKMTNIPGSLSKFDAEVLNASPVNQTNMMNQGKSLPSSPIKGLSVAHSTSTPHRLNLSAGLHKQISVCESLKSDASSIYDDIIVIGEETLKEDKIENKDGPLKKSNSELEVVEMKDEDGLMMLESKLAELEKDEPVTDEVEEKNPMKECTNEKNEKDTEANTKTNEVVVIENKKQQDISNVNVQTVEVASKKEESTEKRFKRLVEGCIRAFTLILSRYPWHFKSQYRIAHIYFHCKHFKNLSICRELLIGTSFIIPVNGFRCQALFQDRKANNFFIGVWRLPSSDLDRFGSFASHLCRSVVLLVDLLRRSVNSSLLFQLHMQLSRSPDSANKKYLRDYDRKFLSKEAFNLCVQILNQKIQYLIEKEQKVTNYTSEKIRDEMVDAMVTVYQMRLQCFKMPTQAFDDILLLLYRHLTKTKSDYKPSFDELRRYCNQQQNARIFQRAQGARNSQVASPPYNINKNVHPLNTALPSNHSTPNFKSTPYNNSQFNSPSSNLYSSNTSHEYSNYSIHNPNQSLNHSMTTPKSSSTSLNPSKVSTPAYHLGKSNFSFCASQQKQNVKTSYQQNSAKQQQTQPHNITTPLQQVQYKSHKQLFTSLSTSLQNQPSNLSQQTNQQHTIVIQPTNSQHKGFQQTSQPQNKITQQSNPHQRIVHQASLHHKVAQQTTPQHKLSQQTTPQHKVVQQLPPQHKVLQQTPPQHKLSQQTLPQHKRQPGTPTFDLSHQHSLQSNPTPSYMQPQSKKTLPEATQVVSQAPLHNHPKKSADQNIRLQQSLQRPIQAVNNADNERFKSSYMPTYHLHHNTTSAQLPTQTAGHASHATKLTAFNIEKNYMNEDVIVLEDSD